MWFLFGIGIALCAVALLKFRSQSPRFWVTVECKTLDVHIKHSVRQYGTSGTGVRADLPCFSLVAKYSFDIDGQTIYSMNVMEDVEGIHYWALSEAQSAQQKILAENRCFVHRINNRRSVLLLTSRARNEHWTAVMIGGVLISLIGLWFLIVT
jgi:hypothetical protein